MYIRYYKIALRVSRQNRVALILKKNFTSEMNKSHPKDKIFESIYNR